MGWLATSLLLSVALTIVLNVVVRAFPGAGASIGRKLDGLADRGRRDRDGDRRRVQVWFPWKGMLIASVTLTVVLNLLLR